MTTEYRLGDWVLLAVTDRRTDQALVVDPRGQDTGVLRIRRRVGHRLAKQATVPLTDVLGLVPVELRPATVLVME